MQTLHACLQMKRGNLSYKMLYLTKALFVETIPNVHKTI